jgi:cell division protein FtsI/penicillin-binding protein 2
VPTPVLLRGRDTKVTGPAGALPPGITGPIREMMREVVTAGTASTLAGLPDVHGKTGTAQFGDGTQSHAWFVGYRGDLAFGVLVVGGGESSIAVSATNTFLTGLH